MYVYMHVFHSIIIFEDIATRQQFLIRSSIGFKNAYLKYTSL